MSQVEYSVWDAAKGAYDYYVAPGSLRAGVMAPAPRLSGGRIGITVEQAARALPAGAKHIGSGPLARGMVASRKSGLAGVGDLFGPNLLVLGAIAAGLYFFWWKRR